MGLRDEIRGRRDSVQAASPETERFNAFGIVDNPFPSASQTQGHPHMKTEADEQVVSYVKEYDSSRSSQVVVIEGDQGTGKTNLLNYYEREFKELYREEDGFYVIRYYADPEPGFDKMLARVLQELGSGFIQEVGQAIAKLDEDKCNAIVEIARLSDMRTVLRSLRKAALESEDALGRTAEAAIEWILGFRLLKRHREVLGPIHFRLDTVESRTQALRDLVFCSAELGALNGVILLLDELEKQDDTKSKMTILRFLSAIRALIDALPRYLFLMAAMTPEARRRYFEMLPAFAGRLQNRVELPYLKSQDAAVELHRFYLEEAKKRAASAQGRDAPDDARSVVSEGEAVTVFDTLMESSRNRGDEGVRQRDYLNELHKVAEQALTG